MGEGGWELCPSGQTVFVYVLQGFRFRIPWRRLSAFFGPAFFSISDVSFSVCCILTFPSSALPQCKKHSLEKYSGVVVMRVAHTVTFPNLCFAAKSRIQESVSSEHSFCWSRRNNSGKFKELWHHLVLLLLLLLFVLRAVQLKVKRPFWVTVVLVDGPQSPNLMGLRWPRGLDANKSPCL